MTGRSKAIGFPIVLAAIMSLLTLPAYAQAFKKGGVGAPAVESRPRVDEKAYKDALERIPTPKQGYDHWGQVRRPETAKTTVKPNQSRFAAGDAAASSTPSKRRSTSCQSDLKMHG